MVVLQGVKNENENENENDGANELQVKNEIGGQLWFAILATLMSFGLRKRTAVSFGSRSQQCLGGAIQPVLGCDEIGAIWGWGRWRDRRFSFWCDRNFSFCCDAISFCCFSLSLSSIFLGWKSFEGKMETEIHFRLGRAILQSTWKLISI